MCPTLQTIITDYEARAADIRAIREAVFIVEQGVPRELEFDHRDPLCQHAVVYSGETPLGTGRIDLENDGKIGRMAVRFDRRRQGVGRRLMIALEDHARNAGASRAWCHAQLQAVPFYQALGYQTLGQEFMEAGIAHLVMEKRWHGRD